MGTVPKLWSPAEIDQATKLWKEGLTSTEIGRRLDRSRCAVLARLDRSGLIGENPTRRITASRIVSASVNPRKPKPPRKSIAVEVLTAPNETALLLVERRRSQCAWPIGTPDRPARQLCCGAPVNTTANKPLASYCTAHGRAATGGKS